LWIAIGGVAVAAVVLAVVIILVAKGNQGAPEELPPPEPVVVTVTEPPPSPTISPVALPADTPFAQALPATVGAYSLTATSVFDPWITQGAIEAYVLVYSDGVQEVTVAAGQWPVAEAAEAALAAADLAAVVAGAAANPGEGEFAWANESAAFAVNGPADVVDGFAALFPL
jgi:hypothetical protein